MSRPAPGRPQSTDDDADRADAEAIRQTADGVRSVLARGRPKSGPNRILRIAIWYLWEVPRLPRPLVPMQYPHSYPWSPKAFCKYHDVKGVRPEHGWGLVYEHLYPAELVARDVLALGESASAEALVEMCKERLMGAVITSDEHRALMKPKASNRPWLEYKDQPWLRYADLPVEKFKRLNQTLAGF